MVVTGCEPKVDALKPNVVFAGWELVVVVAVVGAVVGAVVVAVDVAGVEFKEKENEGFGVAGVGCEVETPEGCEEKLKPPLNPLEVVELGANVAEVVVVLLPPIAPKLMLVFKPDAVLVPRPPRLGVVGAPVAVF